MTTTPRGSPELAAAQAVPETTVNEQIRRTEAGACHFPVTDRVTAPPGSCADGANYLIIATATGAFAGKETQIATAVGTNAASGWYYHTPIEGFTAYVMDENARYLFDGAAWGIDTTGGSYTDENVRDVVAAMVQDSSTIDFTNNDGGDTATLDVIMSAIKPTESLIVACSDETTAITTGTAKATFRMPYAFTLTAVRASVTTAPTGSTILIDINESGTTILSTKLMIDASEKTSTTAATPAVISDSSLADDAEITIDFDQVGSTIAGAGVKVYLIGTRT